MCNMIEGRGEWQLEKKKESKARALYSLCEKKTCMTLLLLGYKL